MALLRVVVTCEDRGFHLPLTVTIGSLNTSLRDAWRDASWQEKVQFQGADWSEGNQVACWLYAAECVHSTEVLSLVYMLRNHVRRACCRLLWRCR